MAEEIKQTETPEIPTITLSEDPAQEQMRRKTEAEIIAEAKEAFNELMAERYGEGSSIFQLSEEEMENLHCPVVANITANNTGVLRSYLVSAGGMAVAQGLFDRGIEDPRVVYFNNAVHNLSIKDHVKKIEQQQEDGTKIPVYKNAPIYMQAGTEGMSISKVPLVSRDYKFSPKDPAFHGKDIRMKEEHCFTLVPVSALYTNAFDPVFVLKPEENFNEFSRQQDKDVMFKICVKDIARRLAEAKEQGRDINFWDEINNGVEATKAAIEQAKSQRELALYEYDLSKEYTTLEERALYTLAREFQAVVDDTKYSEEALPKNYVIDTACKLISNPKVKFPKEVITEVMNKYAPGAVNNSGYGDWVFKQAKKALSISRNIHKKEKAEKTAALAR